jgi:hypothetical protein
MTKGHQIVIHTTQDKPPAGFVVVVDWTTLDAHQTKVWERCSGRDACHGLQVAAAAAGGWTPDLLLVDYSEIVDGVVHLHHVPVPTLIEIVDGLPMVSISGVRMPVWAKQWPAGEDDQKRWLVGQVRERNRLHQRAERLRGGFSVAPSGIVDLVAGSFPTRMPEADRVRVVERAAGDGVAVEAQREPFTGDLLRRDVRVRVSFDDLTRERISTIRRRRSRQRVGASVSLSLPLPFDAVEGQLNDWRRLALSRVSFFDTRQMRVLLAGMHLASVRGGHFPAAPSEILKVWGLQPKVVRGTLRQQVEDDLQMLTEAEIRIEQMGSGKYLQLPLLQRYGTMGIRGRGEVPLLNIHPMLWQPVERGKGLFFDPRILAIDDQRQDWHLRIYLHLAGAWSLGWVTNRRMREGGGQVRVPLDQLLAGSGIDAASMLERGGRGLPHLLQRVQGVLDDLAKWPGGPLIADPVLHRGGSLAECVAEAAAPAALAGTLTDRREGTLTALADAANRPKRQTAKQRRSRTARTTKSDG